MSMVIVATILGALGLIAMSALAAVVVRVRLTNSRLAAEEAVVLAAAAAEREADTALRALGRLRDTSFTARNRLRGAVSDELGEWRLGEGAVAEAKAACVAARIAVVAADGLDGYEDGEGDLSRGARVEREITEWVVWLRANHEVGRCFPVEPAGFKG